MMDNPHVTCVMPVAAGHEHFVVAARECFRRQTYAYRGLIMSINSHGESTLGDIRNALVRDARGEYIAHWDVDDWSSPDRLAVQVAMLQDQRIQVAGFSRVDWHDLRDDSAYLYSGEWCSNLGTSLMYRRSWALEHPFPASSRGEDLGMVNAAAAQGVYASRCGLGLMVAREHDANTARRDFGAGPFAKYKYWRDALPAAYVAAESARRRG